MAYSMKKFLLSILTLCMIINPVAQASWWGMQENSFFTYCVAGASLLVGSLGTGFFVNWKKNRIIDQLKKDSVDSMSAAEQAKNSLQEQHDSLQKKHDSLMKTFEELKAQNNPQQEKFNEEVKDLKNVHEKTLQQSEQDKEKNFELMGKIIEDFRSYSDSLTKHISEQKNQLDIEKIRNAELMNLFNSKKSAGAIILKYDDGTLKCYNCTSNKFLDDITPKDFILQSEQLLQDAQHQNQLLIALLGNIGLNIRLTKQDDDSYVFEELSNSNGQPQRLSMQQLADNFKARSSMTTFTEKYSTIFVPVNSTNSNGTKVLYDLGSIDIE